MAGDSPTPVPRSMELRTLIERSGLTLPMIWTPLPAERWASCEWCEQGSLMLTRRRLSCGLFQTGGGHFGCGHPSVSSILSAVVL